MTRDDARSERAIIDLDEMARRYSNWGRWGDDDEIGTVNFISPQKRVEAAALVRTGRSFSLAIPLGDMGPIPSSDIRFNPQHTMLATGTDASAGIQPFNAEGWGYADDAISMPLQCATQWDALAHIFHNDLMYNGRDCRLVSSRGAACNSIDRLANGLATRGVLIDLPRAMGVTWLDLDYHVTVADLESALRRQRTEVRSGDVVLIRTGNMERARRNGGWDSYTHTDEPGVGVDAIPWFYEHEVAGTANDTWSYEVLPSGTSVWLPFHVLAIVHMGLLIGEMFYLDELAAACAADGQYDFLFVAPPLPFTNAVGSPVNPLAIK